MSERMVAMSDEQARILEDVGVEMMRRQDDRAMKVLALSLAFKFAKPLEPGLPDNVVEFPRTTGHGAGLMGAWRESFRPESRRV